MHFLILILACFLCYRLFQGPLKLMEICPLTSIDSSLSLINSNLIKIALSVLDPSGRCSCSLGCDSPQRFCAQSVLFARVRGSVRRHVNLTVIAILATPRWTGLS